MSDTSVQIDMKTSPAMGDFSRADDAATRRQKRSAPDGAGSKNEILNAAALCFEENGFAATSIDDVASALNATKGKIYHHFRSKTDLFFAVYRQGMEINFEATAPYIKNVASVKNAAGTENGASGGDDALTRLTRMAMAHSVVLLAYQPFQRVLAQGVAMHQSGSTTAAQRDVLVDLIDIRNQYEARFRASIDDTAAEQGLELSSSSVATKCFLAALNSSVIWYRPLQENSRAEHIELSRTIVTYALQGLGVEVRPAAFENLENEL